ncbi:uncharacterized protein B0I36DRAFT_357346 [Microdochium trichocladiopsis]|uniref:DUF7918 domain-containing protein n=1 Tax=Microdochium trichocladiopsis TaxID=1682393 RepID=A0A9P8YHA7_9PEZI|nr:uncharacterized protein B0I36DRAFT_357346 [Microdochium trichocladiopsis]KAH7039983.1 hypothetical protein B0I36DRAFT_357346 [Microdochium trichocladiopsis]
MAILESVPGIEVTIEVAGSTADEFDDPNTTNPASEKSLTKYIECIDDAEFAVMTKIGHGFLWDEAQVLVFTIHVDGVPARAKIFGPRNVDKVQKCEGVLEHQPGKAGWGVRKFKFSPMQIVDAANRNNTHSTKSIYSKLGTLSIEIERRIILTKKNSSSIAYSGTRPASVTEKQIKGQAVSHSVSVSSKLETVNPTFFDTKPVASDDGPIAVFNFLYRSRTALKHELIIPRTPSPDPLDGMSMEELRKLARIGMSRPFKPEGGVKRERAEPSDSIDLTEEKAFLQTAKRTRREPPVDLTDD